MLLSAKADIRPSVSRQALYLRFIIAVACRFEHVCIRYTYIHRNGRFPFTGKVDKEEFRSTRERQWPYCPSSSFDNLFLFSEEAISNNMISEKRIEQGIKRREGGLKVAGEL